MSRKSIITLAALAAVSFFVASATAASIAEFNGATAEGFVDFEGGGAGRINGETVSGGFLSGTTQANDSQLRKFTTDGEAVSGSNNFSFNVADFTAIEIRMLVDIGGDGLAGSTGDFTVIIYDTNPTGAIISSNPVSAIKSTGAKALAADNSFATYVFEFDSAADFSSSNPTFTDGVAEGVRLDVINGATGSTFQVDYIRLIPVPEPTAISAVLGLGALALRRRK